MGKPKAKAKAPPKALSALAQLIVLFRARSRLSVRELAKRVGISHPTLSAIETDVTRPSPEILQALAEALQLDDFDRERLQRAIHNPEVPPGTIVSAQKLIALEAGRDDLQEVWIVTWTPMELVDETALAAVQRNIAKGCKYVYLLGRRSLWPDLLDRIVNHPVAKDAVVTPQMAQAQITCILVPAALQAFLLNPEFVLFIKKKESRLGVWIFRGPNEVMQAGCEMHEFDSHELYLALSLIVEEARSGNHYTFADRAIEFTVLHGPRMAMPRE